MIPTLHPQPYLQMMTTVLRRWPSCVAALLLILTATDATAQHVASTIDVTGMNMRYHDSLSASGTSVSPAIRTEWNRGTLSLSGVYSGRGAAGSALEGSAGGSLYSPTWRRLILEGAATAHGASQSGAAIAQTMLIGRAHLMTERVGAWLGLGGGQSWNRGVRGDRRALEGALWMQHGGFTTIVTASPTTLADTTHYTDVQLAARWMRDRFEFGAMASTRSGLRGAVVHDGIATWGAVSATAWIVSHVALVAGAGSYPAEQTLGYPGGSVATLGIRLASHRSDAIAQRGAVQTDPFAGRAAGHPAGASRFSVEPDGRGTWTIRLHAPRAQRVEITGDFARWHTLSMKSVGNGWWQATVPLARGSYEIEMRVDGGPWTAPPGLASVNDEFGGASGLLVMPR